ncbi:sulfatase-like hydrolase/transferase [Flavicella marina]|uniref:sulfatase-like hydrolase/transferase n=1 Tax=Flavicella marina TaxID=1475951 RepID=UPI0012659714|nr:sulfatase-like hydrolase/transferase [Flavicella marina]
MQKYLKQLLLSVFLFSINSISQVTTATSPNIIFILIDDLGYMDTACYGSTFYETPNIDQLASDGIRFTHGYEAAPRCAASRTSIMTGKFEARPSVSSGMYLPSDNHEKGYAETTWAQALKDQGYKTFFIGKWHLGHDTDHYPDSFGFDINIAGCDMGSPPSYWYPYSDGDDVLPDLSTGGENGEYLTDRITKEVEDFIDDHVLNSPTVPFVTMVSHYAVHTPLEAKAADESYFQTKADNQNYTGPETENQLTAQAKLNQDNAAYGAMIKSMDESVAAIRQNLIDNEIEDNTIIVFTSDNGGLSTTEIGGSRELSTSSKPLRGGKTWLYEGGIRLPLIIYGPDYRSGVVEDTPVVGTDFYPTFLDMAGVPLLPSQHLDGESFEELLLTNANGGYANWTRNKSIVWNFDYSSKGTANVSMAAVRSGNYKLIEHKYNNEFELFDVVNDIGENTDLSATNTTTLNALKDSLFNFRSESGITHRVTNANFKETNTYLYENMNSETGSSIVEDFGCAAPSESDKIIFNKGFECWYDLDWSLVVDASQAATFTDAESASKSGDSGAQIDVTTGGSLGKVKLTNTPNYNNFNGATVTVGAYIKSADAARFKFQIKVSYSDNTTETFISSTKYTGTDDYEFYSDDFVMPSKDTESIEVRLQCGQTVGVIFVDDWYSKVDGGSLSTPLIDEELIVVSPNPTRNFLHIKGPLITQKVLLLDSTGKLLLKKNGDVESINIEELSTGMYYLKIFFESGSHVTKRIIKN